MPDNPIQPISLQLVPDPRTISCNRVQVLGPVFKMGASYILIAQALTFLQGFKMKIVTDYLFNLDQ